MHPLAFKTATDVYKAINLLNVQFRKHQCTTRAFIGSATTVELDGGPPAGIECDIVNGVLDACGGVYGTEWFQAPPECA